MSERRPWIQEQDKILKYLREVEKVKKWSEIAKILQLTYGIEGRNQKQCRQRYQNHLNSDIITEKLTENEQKLLFQLHEEQGNKWSVIANNFPGRTDNTLKNHFHSKLRGAIRKINRYIGCKKKRGAKSYPLSIVYKIVKYFGQSGKDIVDSNENYVIKSLKNGLLKFAGANIVCQQFDLEQKNQKKMAEKIVALLQKFEKIAKCQSKRRISQISEEEILNFKQNKMVRTQQAFPQNNENNDCQLFRTFSQNSFIEKKSSLKESQQNIDVSRIKKTVPFVKQISKNALSEEPELQFQGLQLGKKKSSSVSQVDSDIRKLVQQKNISSSGNPKIKKLTSFGSYSMQMIDENQFKRNDSLGNKNSNIWTKDLDCQMKLDQWILFTFTFFIIFANYQKFNLKQKIQNLNLYLIKQDQLKFKVKQIKI